MNNDIGCPMHLLLSLQNYDMAWVDVGYLTVNHHGFLKHFKLGEERKKLKISSPRKRKMKEASTK